MNSVRSSLVKAIPQKPSRYICLRCYSTKPDTETTTHFGFRTIESEKKEEMGKIQFLTPCNTGSRRCLLLSSQKIRYHERCNVPLHPSSLERSFRQNTQPRQPQFSNENP